MRLFFFQRLQDRKRIGDLKAFLALMSAGKNYFFLWLLLELIVADLFSESMSAWRYHRQYDSRFAYNQNSYLPPFLSSSSHWGGNRLSSLRIFFSRETIRFCWILLGKGQCWSCFILVSGPNWEAKNRERATALCALSQFSWAHVC